MILSQNNLQFSPISQNIVVQYYSSTVLQYTKLREEKRREERGDLF